MPGKFFVAARRSIINSSLQVQFPVKKATLGVRRLLLAAIFIPLFIFCLHPVIGAQETVEGRPHATPIEDEKTSLLERKGLKDVPEGAARDEKTADAPEDIQETLRRLRERQADIGADMTALADQVRKLRGELEELNNPERVKMDRRDIQAALDDLNARMRNIEHLVGARGMKSTAKDAKGEAPPDGPTGPAEAAKAGKPDIKEHYNDAFKDFKDGEYDRSRSKFQAFLKLFPDASLASGAQFWIGESYYIEGNTEKAIIEYDKVIKHYPKGEMIPHALLKQGLSFQKIGDNTGARILLEKLVSDYPDTSQAKIAASTLATLK
jgi:tol-pal system protein YbgF